MPDWLPDAVKALLGALLGGGLVKAVLDRRTGHETASTMAITAQLDQQTRRLDGEIAVLKTLYEAAAQRLDKTEAALAVERDGHQQCQRDLADERAQRQREVGTLRDEVAWMRRALEGRGGGRDDS